MYKFLKNQKETLGLILTEYEFFSNKLSIKIKLSDDNPIYFSITKGEEILTEETEDLKIKSLENFIKILNFRSINFPEGLVLYGYDNVIENYEDHGINLKIMDILGEIINGKIIIIKDGDNDLRISYAESFIVENTLNISVKTLQETTLLFKELILAGYKLNNYLV